MSRTSFSRRFSFTSGRKNSRDSKQHPNSSKDSSHHHHNSMRDKRQHSRRENPDMERVARGIFGDVPLTDTERRFLSAAETGHLAALEQCVEENGNLNLNCRDYLGRTALQLAVLCEHFDCIQYLLEKTSMDAIEEALLHAIKTENVKICDMFLMHAMYTDKRARMQLEFQHGFYDQEDNSSSFAPDITPIVLAAQCNNFDIVHMLIQKGFNIQRPHHYFCYCTECSNHKTFDRFVHSRSRLNAYRGLASTAYLSLSCDDPILAAFELSKSLENLAETEKEYKNEYRTLSESCKNYAVDLLDLCRSNEEVMAALHGGSDRRDLSRIKMAIRYDQKKFIAHASCQEHLMSMWYAGVPWFQHQPYTMKLFLLPLGIMFIPVTAIVYVFLPYSKVGEVLRSPFMKFVNYICSYTAFLVLLFFATTLTSTSSEDLFAGTEGVVNGLIMFYVIGMFWAECKQLWEEGIRGYFSQMWNYMDITMLALYTAAYAVEGVIYAKVSLLSADLTQARGNISMGGEDDSIPDPQILSRVLFSVANVMSFARIAYILPASETFGQLQISYGRMLQDVGKFIFIYFTVMIAFICGLTSLYSLSENNHFTSLVQTTGTLFWAAFGMGTSAAPQIAVGGRHNMVEVVGYILYGVYILGAVVVLINMLIAMMSNTFEEIQECEDIEWKFARAKLWISFIEEGTTLPIPFNIVPTPKSILKVFYYVKNGVSGCASYPAGGEDNDGGFEIDYKAIMHKVVLRYIHKMKFEKKGDSLKEDLLDSKEEILAQTYNMCSSLHQRLESIERYTFIHAQGKDHKDENASCTVATSNTTTTRTVTAPSPNTIHMPLQATRSVPSHVTDVSSNGNGALSASYYEPRRDFGSRRWSYYHDRPRRQDRHKSQHDQTTSASKTLSTEGLSPQQQLQQSPHQQHQRNDHSPTRQQIREDNSFRRERVRNEYSPVRYEDKGGHSPVRLQETADHPLMSTWREEDSEIGMRRTGSRYDSRQQKTEQRTMPYGHSESTLRFQYSTRNPNSCSDDQPSSLSPNPSPQFLSKDDPIPLPDLTPTRTRTLKREFSRTERHFTQGGTRRKNRSLSLEDGGGESGRGGGGSGRGGRGSLTPRASPTPSISQCQSSPVHSPPHSHETVLVSDRHARTQSLHRQQARTTFSSKGHVLTSQGSKEV